jgi:hypothetical protein
MKVYLCVMIWGLALFFNSCVGSHNQLTVVDDSMDPRISNSQIFLGNLRGDVGIMHYNQDAYKEKITDYKRYSSKLWILEAWGAPDRTERKNGLNILLMMDPKMEEDP